MTSTGYVSKDRDVLIECLAVGGLVDTNDRGLIRRSEDNGASWQTVEQLTAQRQIIGDLVEVTLMPSVFSCDPQSGRLFRVFHIHLNKPNVVPWDYAVHPTWRTIRPYSQVSRDEGQSWSDPVPVVVQGDQFDASHWCPGIWQGKNGGVLGATPIISGGKGVHIAPLCSNQLFTNGDIIDPDADPATANPDGAVEWQGSCLHAKWLPDGSGLTWNAGEKVRLPRKYSCDGADEPSVDYLPDGRLFMILRARTYPHTGQELPGMHYYALSEDDGMTWAEPEPLLFDDGGYAKSPACISNVLRSNKNDRFYVITNFTDQSPVNCDPRNELYIAEIDPERCRIKKSTMTIIDQQPLERNIRYSNWRYYQDRRSGNVMLFMTPSCPETVELDAGLAPHAYRYEIELPD